MMKQPKSGNSFQILQYSLVNRYNTVKIYVERYAFSLS